MSKVNLKSLQKMETSRLKNLLKESHEMLELGKIPVTPETRVIWKNGFRWLRWNLRNENKIYFSAILLNSIQVFSLRYSSNFFKLKN